MSTIAAISTPLAMGGISVIRISGEKAINVASKIFQPISCESVEKMDGYTCCYGKVVYENQDIDDTVLTVFRAPRSYTGEDVCEISCHGGVYITKQVLSAVLASGAKPAENGEFTKRAFLNGKLSLTQAESVMDLISAQGKQAHRSAIATREGTLFKRIKTISDEFVSMSADFFAWVDYPDEDIEDIDIKSMCDKLANLIEQLKNILCEYDNGRILRDGIDTVIVGKPNVGKSTLMNMLLGYQRSIVTDVAGTTRDVVEETVSLGDVVLRLSDTAGVHETVDIVEGVGVDLAYKKLNQADLVIAVFDNSEKLSQEDIDLIDKLGDKPCVAVINKSDLVGVIDKAVLKEHFDKILYISAKNNEGKSQLTKALEDLFHTSSFDPNSGVISNERQRSCVTRAIKYASMTLKDLYEGANYDATTIYLDEAINSLLELTGEKATDAVVDNIFKNFCVGK